MSERAVVINVEVGDEDDEVCGEGCVFNDSDTYCQLFDDSVEGGKRCVECVNAEVK